MAHDGYVQVGDLRTRYFDSGSGSDKVILIHGLGGSIDSWRNNIGELSKQFRVFALDLPGFGYSDKPAKNYTIRFFRDFMATFIENLGLGTASIVGSSLGGQIAAELAIGRPELVRRLVLTSPPGALPRSYKGSPALKRYTRITKARSLEQARDALFSVDNMPVDEEYARSVFQRLSLPGAREAFVSSLKASASAERLNKRLTRIRCPTLVIWGKQDTMIPVKFAGPFIGMENCRVVMLEGCSHRPHAEKAKIFNRIVTDFLKEQDETN